MKEKMKERKSSKEKKAEYRKGNDKYFEAILQLREFNEDQFNRIIDFIEASKCGIAKHVEQKEGVDIYLESQKFTQQLGRWIKGKYTCHLTSTRKLHTRDVRANKDLYRVTVCIRFLKHKVGDIIEYNGEKVRLTSLGSKPSGRIEGTGKRIFLDPKTV